MGFEFSLILSREISEEESSDLLDAGCSGVVFTTDTLPTNAEVTVTKMEFDDTVSPSLAEAIESALEAVKKLSDLSASGLVVPAQPAERPSEDASADVVTGDVVTGEAVAAEDAPGEAVAVENVVAEDAPVEDVVAEDVAAENLAAENASV